MRKKKCFFDSYKYTEMCVNNDELKLDYTRKGKKEYNKWLNNAKKNQDLNDLNNSDIEILKNAVKQPIYSVSQSNINVFTCEHDQDYDRDILLLLQNSNDNDNTQLKQINLKSGSCKQIKSKKLFDAHFLPIELFDDFIKTRGSKVN